MPVNFCLPSAPRKPAPKGTRWPCLAPINPSYPLIFPLFHIISTMLNKWKCKLIKDLTTLYPFQVFGLLLLDRQGGRKCKREQGSGWKTFLAQFVFLSVLMERLNTGSNRRSSSSTLGWKWTLAHGGYINQKIIEGNDNKDPMKYHVLPCWHENARIHTFFIHRAEKTAPLS